MTWLTSKKDELPEELRDLSPAQIAAAVKESETLKAKLSELETKGSERDTAFESFRAENEELKATVEDLKSRIPEARPKPDAPRELTSFIVDPDRAFAERAAPLASMVLQTSGILAKNELMRRLQAKQRTAPGCVDGFLFEKFENEIMDLASRTGAQALANPETWEHLFYNVKGRHADEIAAHHKAGQGEYFIESGSAGGGAPPKPDEVGKLTPLELKIAKKTGVTPEQYLEQKKKISVGIPSGVLAGLEEGA